MRYIIFNADDFGLCNSTNQAIKNLFINGFVSSTSLMTPAPWAEKAAELVNMYPQIKCGMHATFTSEWKNFRWKPLSTNSCLLEGDYLPLRTQLCTDYKIIKEELELQYDFMLKRNIVPNHIDDHMFSLCSNMKPLIDLCQEKNAKLRLPKKNLLKGMNEQVHMQAVEFAQQKRIPTIDYLYKFPVHFNVEMTYYEFKEAYIRLFYNFQEGINEVYMHPSINSEEMKAICHERACLKRYFEYIFLQDDEILKFLDKEDIKIIGWEQVEFREALVNR